MNDPVVESKSVESKSVESKSSAELATDKVSLSIEMDAELFEQINHLTNNPSKVIEVAVRQWLGGGRRDDDLTRTLRRNPPVPPKGEWND